jgi:hypothetical protein
MKTCRSRPGIRASAWSVLAALGATFGLIGISAAQQQPACTPQQPLQAPGVLCLDTPAPPDTVPVAQPDWDVFAWNTFIALNWPALEVVPNSYRGVPDLSKLFATAASSDLAVWETFKEKREIFNQVDNPGGLVWNSPVNYGPLRAGAVGPAVTIQGRVIHQNSGVTMPPDGLDETVEVQSQSLEQTYPNGTPNPILGASPPVATPRVWRGQPSAQNPIVYEVKLNYDYFNYVVGNGFNVNNSQAGNAVATAALNANIHLPIRTSSSTNPLGTSPPPMPGPNPGVVNYRAAQAVATFQTINEIYRRGGALPAPLPPPQGSIQVKAAWLKLGGPDARPSDFPTWHTAIAQNYISDPTGKPIASVPTLFGLVGMHIIQRIHATNPSAPNAQPPGGTFIFATWEHESIFNSPVAGSPTANAPYSYSNFYAPPPPPPPPALASGFYPPLDQTAYPVVRQYPVLQNTIGVTKMVHDQIRARNPNSVWLNYHLVGTQFQTVDLRNPGSPGKFPVGPNDPTGIGQPVFLANLGIETNLGLQFFQGQPPAITVIKNYQPPLSSNATKTFLRNNANTAFRGAGYNMGGCMGCHGVAQSKGYGFSFVLLDGYVGAVTDTQEHFDQPGANP